LFKVAPSLRTPWASCRWRAAAGLTLILGLFASRAGAQSGCPGTASAFGGPQFPTYSNAIANSGVVAGDQYVYFLSYYGFVRVNISNPDAPSSPQLANVGHDRPNGGSPPWYNDGGPVVVDCDCHGGARAMAAAESPSGDSRLISDWEPSINFSGSQALPYQAASTERGFQFGQQVNAQPPLSTGVPLAAIYLPPNKFFGYFPTGYGYVQTVDLTTTTGLSGQYCPPSLFNCQSDPAKGLQPLAQTLPWTTNSGYGLWAGSAVVGGQTKYFLVGTGGGLIRVASIDPSSGIPTQIGSTPYTNVPEEIAIATVNGGAFLFSAEDAFSAGNGKGGLQVYEIRSDNTVVRVQQPAAFQLNFTRVVVKASSPSTPAPLIFAHRNSGGSFIDIYDTNWLTPGISVPTQSPRLGGSIPHLGKYISGSIVGATSFGAKVVQSGSIVNAYVFEVLVTSPQDSIAVTKKDVSCISSDPTAPAVASLQMTNLSAAARTAPENTKNYYGDRWRMQDTSSTGIPLNLVQWDLVAPDTSTASLAPDPSPTWSMSQPGTVPAYLEALDGGSGSGPGILWPCDPSGAIAGDPNSGSNCNASISPTGPYNIKILAQNANGPGSSPIAAGSKSVLAPTVYVNGFANPVPTINVLTSEGVLSALSSPSTQGNTADATFQWTFTPPGSAAGPVVNVPSNATDFSLSVTYKDGYVAPTVAGLINQTDLVAAFSLQSSSVLVGPNGQLTLINKMQKAASATLNRVDYLVLQGETTISSGTLAASFNVVNGTASITAPSALGSYTVRLIYYYTGQSGSQQPQTPPDQPFSTVNFSAAPIIGIFYNAAATQPVTCSFGCNLVAGTTYYLADGEQVPGGVTYPVGNFYFFNGTTDAFQAAQPTAGLTVPFTPTAVCPSGCYVHVLVGGVDSSHLAVSVASSTQPLLASVNGPTGGSVNVPVTFSANVTGGVAPYSYQWACQYAGSFTSYLPGGSTFPCTYSSANTYQVVVRVTDNASNAVQSSPFSVFIGGGGGGQFSASISGPNPPYGNVGVPVNFTAAVSGGVAPYSYQWACQYAGSFTSYVPGGSTFQCTYSSATTYQVVVRVTDNASNVAPSSPFSVIIAPPLGPPAPSATYTVQGAKLNPFNRTYDAEAGQAITFNALEIPANVAANGYTWDFGDGSPRHGQQVAFTFAGTGARQVTLTVTGDGTNRAGAASSVILFNVLVPSFQALLVPAAEHFFPVPGDSNKVSATDVAVSNPGTTPLTISPAFLGFSATIPNNVFDLSTVAFEPSKKVTIPPNGIWSQVDVVKYLGGDAPNKGTLVFKYEGGDATPLATCRVYVAPFADPLGASAGSAFPPLKATKDGRVLPQGTQPPVEQSLPGLRGDASYDFRMSLFNSVGISGMFRISAVDQDGNTVTTLKDPLTGVPGSYVDFGIGPYQAVDWSSDDLGLSDPTKRYVLKASKTPGFTTGLLLPLVTMRDRVTRDQVIVTSDGPPEYREPCAGNQNCVNYIVAGASRYPTPDGGRWKTSISIYNPSTQTRGLLLTYTYTTTDLLAAEKVASSFIVIAPGKLAAVPGLQGVVCCDDVVSELFATQDNHLADLLNGTFGILRVQHFVDGETSTSPLLISARNYDDQPTGTYGSQLAVYTRPILVGPGQAPLVLAGLQQDDSSNPKPRFAPTYVDVFAYDDVLTVVRLTALKSDGTELGHHIVALNNPGASGHFQRRSVGASDFTGNLNGIQNEPISVKIEVMQGGSVGAYALIQDITTRDPTYVQATPQN
jgi:hypothetical protein